LLFLTTYRAFGRVFLLFDPRRAACEEETVCQLARSRSFCLQADSILVGPLSGPGWSLRVFRPDGTECFCCPAAAKVFAQYLLDAGYTDRCRLLIRCGNTAIPVCVRPGCIAHGSTSSEEEICRALSL